MKNEYIIWGIAPGQKHEDILFTNAQNLAEAKKVVSILESKHNCKNCKIQIIDFSQKIDFSKTLNL
jgi:hypothetical protein